MGKELIYEENQNNTGCFVRSDNARRRTASNCKGTYRADLELEYRKKSGNQHRGTDPTKIRVGSGMRIEYCSTDLERNSMIHLLEIGREIFKSPEQFLGQREDAYLFLLVYRGIVSFSYFGMEYTLTEGKSLFLDMHSEYRISGTGSDAEILWLFFRGPNFKSIYNDILEKNGGICFTVKDCFGYLAIADDIMRYAESEAGFRGLEIYQQILKLLVVLSSEEADTEICPRNPKYASDTIRLDGIIAYLDEHYMEHIRLDELASMFYVDKFYMTKIFRERYRMTIFQYLKNVRLSHARLMLANSNLPIGMIAKECGYEDQSYFFRVFKKEMNMTASEYRRLNQKKLYEKSG